VTAVDQADVVVVGMGVGGEAVAGALAEAGIDVVGIESELVGGECPYWACIPSKMMIRAGNLLAEARRIPGMAGTAVVHPDWAPVALRIREEATDYWNDQVAVDRFIGKGGRFVRGWGRVLDSRTVEVADVGTIRARMALVLATGSRPNLPPVDGLTDTPYWTSRDATSTLELPGSLIVLGGGAVGVELAQAYARFGVTVTVVETADRLVPGEEPEASELLQGVLAGEGITLQLGTRITKVTYDDAGFTLALADEGDIYAERLLVATGRTANLNPNTRSRLGLDADTGPLPVDGQMRVTDGVWAVGDLTGVGAFTHVATYQADLAVADILGRPAPAADYRALPRVTFTDPEIGSVGLKEAQARERGIRVATGIAQVPTSARGWLHKVGNEGLIKLVADTDTGLLVGATSVGPTGGEVLAALAVAIHGRVPQEALRQMIYAYPTFHRGIQDALRNLQEQRR